MFEQLSMSALGDGQSAYVTRVDGDPAMRRRLLDLGLIRGTRVTCIARSPWGDPAAYLVRGAVIALRDQDARDVAVCPWPAAEEPCPVPTV